MQASTLYLNQEDPFLWTPFGEAEFVNAIELRVFRKEISSAQAERSLRDFQQDFDAGSFGVRRPVPAASYERALSLSRRYTRQTGTRGMDVIHIAIALEVRAEVLYTFDRLQGKLAERAGLAIRPRR